VAAPAFIGTPEILVAVVIGVLLFGGDLPKVMRDVARLWLKMRRALDELKRESGLDEALEDIRRETEFRIEAPAWQEPREKRPPATTEAAPEDAEFEPPAAEAETGATAATDIEEAPPPSRGPDASERPAAEPDADR